jgi:processive 1,2-diacylglycerol beta-glucosyltransferase
MIKIYDKESGVLWGEITETQLQFLVGQLEEESSTDQDYYLNQATLEMFEAAGAEADLLALLRRILGEKEEAEFRWEQG